jgi:hypothetical protein
VLPKQIKQADVTKMLFQLRLVSDRRTREQNTFMEPNQAPDLVPANESAIIVEQPQVTGDASAHAASAAADQQFALLLPKMSLEIRAALDLSLQKEIAALRSFIGSTLDSHSERLQGDLATLLPATRTPDLDLPTVIPDRRPWGAISGWSVALIAIGGAAFMSWLWWKQGGEVAALRTDLTAAYAELETLRARPEVVSAPPPVSGPAVLDPAALDPNAVLPAADAADAAPARPGSWSWFLPAKSLRRPRRVHRSRKLLRLSDRIPARQFFSPPALAAGPSFSNHTFQPSAAAFARGAARDPGARRECRTPDRMWRRRNPAGLSRQPREARPRTRQTRRGAAAWLGRQCGLDVRIVDVTDLVLAGLRGRAPEPARSRRHSSPQS